MHGPRWLIGLTLFVTIVTTAVALLLSPTPALADCGADASTCKWCHEGQQQKPVNQIGAWHTQHSFGDFCANCHGGDRTNADLAGAHTGMRPALSDVNASCAACHTTDAEAKAATYKSEKEKLAAAPPETIKLPPPGGNNGVFIVVNIVTFMALGGLYWLMEKGPLAKRFIAPMAGGSQAIALPRNPMARQRWSPYVAGAGLGVVAVLTLLVSKQPLGSSGAFLALTSMGLKASGSPLSDSVYFKFIMPPQVTWQLMLVAGVVLGAFISAIWSKDFKLETSPDQWVKVFGGARWKRWLTIFAGGAILEYGASIAGGCTSGLAIAGSLQLSAAGFLFIGALFATGLLTAKLLYGRDY